MTRAGRLRAGVAAASVTALGLAGCGISEQDSVERINPAQLETLGTTPEVPPSSSVAVDPSTTRPVPTLVPPASSTTLADVRVTLYYVEGDRIVDVRRTVPGGTSLRSIIDLLSQPKEGSGQRSTVPAGLVNSLLGAGSGETVDLDGEIFNAVDPLEQPLMFGQLVLTLTSLPESYDQFTRVRFTLDGEPLPAMLGDSTLSDPGDWVTASDYDELRSPQTATIVTD